MKKGNIVIAVVCLGSIAFGQGSLTPPGAPAPTMKTLTELDAGHDALATDIDALKTDVESGFGELKEGKRDLVKAFPSGIYQITDPGYYYLSTNLVLNHEIRIECVNVTLDLNGFTISCESGYSRQDLIAIVETSTNPEKVVIRNGVLDGKGQQCIGISNYGKKTFVHLENLSVVNCTFGISLHSPAFATHCEAKNCTETGMQVGPGSILDDCTSVSNRMGFSAFDHSIIKNCIAKNNEYIGIAVSEDSIVEECIASGCYGTNDIAGVGIAATYRCTVRNCVTSKNEGDGINVRGDSYVIGNMSFRNGSAGIYISEHDCRVEGNNCTDNGYGIKVDDNGNFIVKNTASGNTTNYLINAGSHYRISTSLTGAEAWDNFEF